MISSRFDIESERNFELKIEKLYSFRHKIYTKTHEFKHMLKLCCSYDSVRFVLVKI
jgi:hypothetical protein